MSPLYMVMLRDPVPEPLKSEALLLKSISLPTGAQSEPDSTGLGRDQTAEPSLPSSQQDQ